MLQLKEQSIFVKYLENIVSLISFSVLCGSYVRYKQLESVDGGIPEKVYKINKISFFLGAIVAGGMSLVANFQVSLSTYSFVCLFIYLFICVYHVYLFLTWSYTMKPTEGLDNNSFRQIA